MSSIAALDTLSRLKGIETRREESLRGHPRRQLWIPFPVWRELKRLQCLYVVVRNSQLWIPFPVWRELKHHIPHGTLAIRFRLWIPFPVWRELKPANWTSHYPLDPPLDTLSRLKGIETRWAIARSSTIRSSLDTLSRLKGIETRISRPSRFCLEIPLDTLSRLKGIETA